MPFVRFEPFGISVEARTGDSLLDTALDHDIPLQHACGGFCSCTTCLVRVIKGSDGLSRMEEDEGERLEETDQAVEGVRLGCQARVRDQDVVVEVLNRDS